MALVEIPKPGWASRAERRHPREQLSDNLNAIAADGKLAIDAAVVDRVQVID